MEFRRQESLLKAGALQDAIFNSANFSSIIEDNPANMRLAGLLLRNAGHMVLSADDAEAGLTPAAAGVEGGLRRTP